MDITNLVVSAIFSILKIAEASGVDAKEIRRRLIETPGLTHNKSKEILDEIQKQLEKK